MKIVLLADFYPPHIGGGEIVMQKIAEGAAGAGHEVDVITSATPGAPALEQKERLTIRRLEAPAFLFRFWYMLKAFFAACRESKGADIIHATTYASVLPAVLAAKLRNIRSVLTVHELMGRNWYQFEPNWFAASFYYFAERLTARLPYDRFIAVSNYTAGRLREMGTPPEKIEVIYNGIPEDVKQPETPPAAVREQYKVRADDFLFLFFGRAGITKGVTFLADALPGILKRIPSARIILVLSPYNADIYHYVQHAVEQLPAESIRLVEPLPRNDLVDLLYAADSVIVPSLSEGFGFTTVEAALAGTPLVAAKAGAIPEVIFGKHVLVEPASAEALVEGCERAYEGNYDIKTVQHITWAEAIRKYVDNYIHLTKLQ